MTLLMKYRIPFTSLSHTFKIPPIKAYHLLTYLCGCILFTSQEVYLIRIMFAIPSFASCLKYLGTDSSWSTNSNIHSHSLVGNMGVCSLFHFKMSFIIKLLSIQTCLRHQQIWISWRKVLASLSVTKRTNKPKPLSQKPKNTSLTKILIFQIYLLVELITFTKPKKIYLKNSLLSHMFSIDPTTSNTSKEHISTNFKKHYKSENKLQIQTYPWIPIKSSVQNKLCSISGASNKMKNYYYFQSLLLNLKQK